MLEHREDRILFWMEQQKRPVLFSEMQKSLGLRIGDEAFEKLRRQGTIKAVFPEAKQGDAGRQFWDFSFMYVADA